MVDVVAVPRLELVVEREADATVSRAITIDADLCRIGSHPSNDVVLQDRLVSRFHCRIVRDRDCWRIVDSGSLNGTRVAGMRLRDADLPLPECRIELGDSVVRVREMGSVSEDTVPVWPAFGAVLGTSVVMRKLYRLLDRVARSDSTVLIEGESGSGKEVIATEIVARGPRADKPLVVVDCSAVSPSLIESELFGHTKGAFTGAERERVGAFAAADGGTVFLDEIGEMPLDLQPKLLRAIESREIRRLGESTARKVDVRVVAATNRRLEREVNHGRFREDLYFRLSVVTVRVPPLRDRMEDLPMLINHFLGHLGALDRQALFTGEVLADLLRHDWPGNVRELRNYVERTVVLEKASPPSRRAPSEPDLPPGSPIDIDRSFREGKEQAIEAYERQYLTALLLWAGGNISQAARKAGLDRMHLHRLVQRYNLRKQAGEP